MTNTLRRLIKNKNLRKKLGSVARKKALEEFSLEKMAERTIKEYKKVISIN